LAGETKFQIAILAERREPGQRFAGSTLAPEGSVSVEWLACEKRDDRWLDFYDASGGLVSAINLDNPVFDLPWLLGIVAIGDAFGDLEERWFAALPATGVVFRRIRESKGGGWDAEDLSRAAIACLADHLAAQRRHAGRAALDLAVYRREFDRVQRSFSRLEEYVGGHFLHRPIEIFEYSPARPGAKGNGLAAESEAATGAACLALAQILPVDSLGFASFALCVVAKPEGREDLLLVRLRAIETGKVYGEWSLRGEDVPFEAGFEAKAGWVEFALSHAIDEAALSLVLDVEWPSKESGWALALGPPHPYEEFCARLVAGGPLRAPLGLRIFGGLPGVRVAATTAAIRPVGAPCLLAAFLGHEAYAGVGQVLPPPAEGKPNLVSYDPEIGCVTVHPRLGGLAVARMKIQPPASAWRLSAHIHLAHEQASPTEFGLMVGLPGDESKNLAALDRLDAASATFSGWIKVAPLEARIISVVFASPPAEALSVYLLTRQDPESSPDFGWARFSKFEFNLLKRSAAVAGAIAESANLTEELVAGRI
jgi:hypothetical protein